MADDRMRRVTIVVPSPPGTTGTQLPLDVDQLVAAARAALDERVTWSTLFVLSDYAPARRDIDDPDPEHWGIEDADLVLLFAERQTPAALYTIGLAQGRGIPLVVLSSDLAPGVRATPVHVFRYPAHPTASIVDELRDVIAYALHDGGSRPRRSSAPRIFVSYSHADRAVLERLLVHLRPLERSAQIDPWSDRKLVVGADWRSEIKQSIERCDVALLLVSADFLASDFIATDELLPILEGAEQRGLTVATLVVGHCRFARMPELARYQAINSPQEPYYSLDGNARDLVLDRLVEQIESTFAAG